MPKVKDEDAWNEHWSREFVSLNKFFKFYRKYVMSNALCYYFERYFPRKGTFVECGSGSSLTSFKIRKYRRTLIALDVSIVALNEAKKMNKFDLFLHADTTEVPLRSNSIDGIWNLGVLEHFTHKNIDRALREYNRVLKRGSYIILFWPPVYSFTGVTYRAIEKAIKFTTGKNFSFYPDEISRLKSKKEAVSIMEKNGFRNCEVYFPWRECFGQLAVIAQK